MNSVRRRIFCLKFDKTIIYVTATKVVEIINLNINSSKSASNIRSLSNKTSINFTVKLFTTKSARTGVRSTKNTLF